MKKYYRITILKASHIAEQIALLAAKSNGGDYLSIPDLIAAAKVFKMVYPALSGEFTPEPIGDNQLVIDANTGGATYETVLSIEEVEVYELEGGEAMAD